MIHRALFAFAGLLLAVALARDGLEIWVARTDLPARLHQVSSEVLDRDGKLLRAYTVESGIWRLATTPADVDPDFLDMLIATEDKRFYRHNGVDPLALLRAAGQALWHGRIVSGGSTLTMQTARLMENSGTGGWAGKLRQTRVALAMERRMSKAQILTLYLTHAPYGANLEGVRAASHAWFGKPARRLSPEEAALLVALPQSPTLRRPDRHPEAATDARDRILSARGHPPARRAVPKRLRPFPQIAPHLADRVHRPGTVTRVGLRADLQTAMEKLARRAVAPLAPQTSAAILVADHQSGEILAYVGAAHYAAGATEGFVDMVQAVRSPGSTLKPLIYSLAFDQGLAHPETMMPDLPVAFGSYTPQNFDGAFRGDVTVRRALEMSLNIPPLLLTEAMGPHRLIAGLERSGATPRLPGQSAPGLAVALGGVGMTLQDLVQLYAGLAAGGQARALHWTRSTPEQAGPRLVSERAAWHVGHILAGIQPPNGQAKGQVAFKTGTSYGHRDAWAIGWDGQHVIGIWLGRPDGTPVPGIFGGDVAAPILFEAFGRLKPQFDPLPVPPSNALLHPTALLPKPLQRFRIRGQAQHLGSDVTIAFPPDGARLRLGPERDIPLKLRGGTPPFVILRDDRPVRTGFRDRDIALSGFTKGFTSLTVIDAIGQSHSIDVALD